MPIAFDTFFWKDSDYLIETSVQIPFSIINGWAPTQTVSLGHKHICLMQFNLEIPPANRELPEVNSEGLNHRQLVLANRLEILAKDSD